MSKCRGCQQSIIWIRTRSGKSSPCDPDKRTEWVTDEPVTTRHRITLQDPDGDTHTGYLATVLTHGARQIDGYVPHWSTCPAAKAFKPGGALR